MAAEKKPRQHGKRVWATRTKIKERLKAEGRWGEYLSEREALARAGVDRKVAWKVPLTKFRPLDGSPLETEMPAELVVATESPAATDTTIKPPPLPIVTDTRTGVPLPLGRAKDQTPVAPPPKTTPEWDEWTQLVIDAAPLWAKYWGSLAKQLVDVPAKSELEIIRWTFENAGTPPQKLDVTLIPSLGSLRYLRHVQERAENYAEFVRTNWARLIPDKKAIDSEDRFRDDGRELFTQMEELEAALAKETSDASDGEDQP